MTLVQDAIVLWAKVRDAAINTFQCTGQTSKMKNSPALNVNSAKVETLWINLIKGKGMSQSGNAILLFSN